MTEEAVTAETEAVPETPKKTEFSAPELKEGRRRVRYDGQSGAAIDTKEGNWNIGAPDWHPQFSPIKDVIERDAQNLVDTSLFYYEE